MHGTRPIEAAKAMILKGLWNTCWNGEPVAGRHLSPDEEETPGRSSAAPAADRRWASEALAALEKAEADQAACSLLGSGPADVFQHPAGPLELGPVLLTPC